MNIGGVIAEYNPFHAGHRHQLAQMRKSGVDRIAVIMSGNFVQRGDVAIQSKFSRALAAVQSGADLVIELPVTYALASAERFAYGGVFLLDALGCVNTLSFGCEDADIPLLRQIAAQLRAPETDTLIREFLKEGISYPAARSKAIRTRMGDHADKVLTKPNNILAVEYLKAADAIGANFDYLPILRQGASHDSADRESGFLSASEIRRMIAAGEGLENIGLPAASYRQISGEIRDRRAPAETKNLERILLYALRRMTGEELRRLPDVSEGLEGRILKAVKSTADLQNLLESIKSKRYPLARIRRVLIYALLGITRDSFRIPPPYLRVLACNANGFDILRTARDTAKLPIVMKTADIRALDASAQTFFDQECKFDDIYALATPQIQPCSTNQTTGVQIVK